VRIFLLVSRGWGWRFEASGAVRSLVFVITPEGFSVNAFLCVESPKYKCGCRSGKSCFLTYDQAQAEIKRFRARRSSFVSLRCAGTQGRTGVSQEEIRRKREIPVKAIHRKDTIVLNPRFQERRR